MLTPQESSLTGRHCPLPPLNTDKCGGRETLPLWVPPPASQLGLMVPALGSPIGLCWGCSQVLVPKGCCGQVEAMIKAFLFYFTPLDFEDSG